VTQRPVAAEPAVGSVAAVASEVGSGGRLFIVATPIGNLSDVTLRALEVLRTVPLVAAEDTRVSRRLLDRHRIATRLTSFHARNAAARMPDLLDHLRGGLDLALVTDAGTPGVSDPGEELVRAWATEGGSIVPIPGPSAVLAAIVASGLSGPRWSFEGFLPRSGRERRERLARIAADERATVLFEAPNRVTSTLLDLAATCGADRPIAICRELTKLHEEIVRGSVGQLAMLARQGALTLRGEFVLVVGAQSTGTVVTATSAQADEELRAARSEVERLVREGMARGDAARRVAASSGLPRRRLYEAPNHGDQEPAAGARGCRPPP
jgi:16S rRNA (cytidine1402-2'-O)-methyltransferase